MLVKTWAGCAGIVVLLVAGSLQAAVVRGVRVPDRPVFDPTSYPNCVQDYTKHGRIEAQVQSVQNCINDLENYNAIILPEFVGRMRKYVAALQKISAAVIKNRRIDGPSRQYIRDYVRDETLNANANDGIYFTKYRYHVAKYRGELRSLLRVRTRQQFPTN